MIPRSIGFILSGAIGGVSISKLFMAGIVLALLIAFPAIVMVPLKFLTG